MSYGSARIDSPEVLKDFRNHLIKFREACQQAMAGVKSDVYHVQRWLQDEQMNHWKRMLQKYEEEALQARHEYNEARFGSPAMRKDSYIDELKAMRRAEQKREDARARIAKIKRWASLLDQQAEKLMGPINQLGQVLDADHPRALADLEAKIQALEEYLRASPPDAGN